jgi:predicted metalloprotease with PDZ domain
MLREPSSSWNDLRRGQDYYYEGMFLWLEVDAIIRQDSGGKHNLDDFCERFFGKVQVPGPVVPYQVEDVTGILKDLADRDWADFFKRRVSLPLEKMPLDVIDLCGCKLEYATKPTPYIDFLGGGEHGSGPISARDSLGVQFTPQGKVGNVVPGMAADKAGLTTGMQVQAVNGKKFTRQRLFDALLESPQSKKLDFLIVEGDAFRTIEVPYAEGPKYLQMVPQAGKRDVIGDILKPLS